MEPMVTTEMMEVDPLRSVQASRFVQDAAGEERVLRPVAREIQEVLPAVSAAVFSVQTHQERPLALF